MHKKLKHQLWRCSYKISLRLYCKQIFLKDVIFMYYANQKIKMDKSPHHIPLTIRLYLYFPCDGYPRDTLPNLTNELAPTC